MCRVFWSRNCERAVFGDVEGIICETPRRLPINTLQLLGV